MSDREITLVQIGGKPDKGEMEEVTRDLGDRFPKREFVVVTDNISMAEIPVMDDMVDEITNRVVKQLNREIEGVEHE